MSYLRRFGEICAFLFHGTIGNIKMLKKSLVALAIASVAGAASAADIQTNTSTLVVSQEGNALHTVIAAQDVKVALDAEYSVGDIVTFTFTGAEVNTATAPNSISVTPDDTHATIKLYGMTLGRLSASATEVVYRVTELSQEGLTTGAGISLSTIGQVITLTGLEFKADTFAGKAQVAYSAQTATGQELDKGEKNSTVLFDGKQQFTADVTTKFDAIIDVNEQRLQFTSGDVTDSATTTLEDHNTGWTGALNVATLAETTHTFYGDFAFLDTDADTDGIQVKAGAVTATPAATSLKVNADSIVLSYNSAVKVATLALDLEGENAGYADEAIATQDFTATVAAKYTANGKDATKDIAKGVDAGEWKLNGAVVHVPFMPFRDGYSPIVNVSNTSNQDGDIEVLVYAQNDAEWVKPVSYTLPVQAKAEAQTNITKALRDSGIEGDVAFDIIVNAPKADIEVSALYYNNGDRAVINTVKQN
jgi:hypothetical protein